MALYPSCTVLVFEDLHWADEALLAFLEHLADWAADVPLLARRAPSSTSAGPAGPGASATRPRSTSPP